MNRPQWTKFMRVDEACECLAISSDTLHALLAAMPDAYAECECPVQSDSGLRHEYPPEPDAPCRVKKSVGRVWDRLSPDAQADLDRAWRKENEAW